MAVRRIVVEEKTGWDSLVPTAICILVFAALVVGILMPKDLLFGRDGVRSCRTYDIQCVRREHDRLPRSRSDAAR